MDVWTKFDNRMAARGYTKRDSVLKAEQSSLLFKLPHNLSFHGVEIDGCEQSVAIIDTDSMNEKKLHSLPGEKITHGGLVFWNNSYWLITELDANNTVYTTAKMIRCNYLLKWVSDDYQIREQWCIVEDGTKYLTGELEDRNFVVTRGDSRIALTISKNEFTTKFDRTSRFLIDDSDSSVKLSYTLTKPLKVGNVYNGTGVFQFVLQETVTTEDDNQDLCIADYYKYFPKHKEESIDQASENSSAASNNHNINNADTQDSGKKVWF